MAARVVRRRTRSVLVAALGIAIAAGAASAARADREQSRPVAADGRAALAVVLVQKDLGWLGPGWTGSRPKASFPFPSPCPDFALDPRQSDLVATGGAASSWQKSGVSLSSDAEVMETAQMARTGWERWAIPRLAACMESAVGSLHLGTTPMSVGRLPLPRIGSFTAAYRVVGDDGTGHRFVEDIALVVKGRTRLSLTTIAAIGSTTDTAGALATAKRVTTAVETQLLRVMARRCP